MTEAGRVYWILNKPEVNFIVILEDRINILVRLTDDWEYSILEITVSEMKVG